MDASVLHVYECHSCFASLPYLGCPHNCCDPDNEDDGFCEDPEVLQQFLVTLHVAQKMKQLRIVHHEAPDPEI